ncbi:MAG TPA: sulfotransferase [Woeseiaceae bacterium]|nr:sulfotransferase [Woeseiaceae bacterium]
MKPTADSTDDDLAARLTEIERLLGTDPAAADARAAALLAAVPGQPMARLFQGIARRLGGRPAAAAEVLGALCETEAEAPLPHLQLGLALQESGERERAVLAMQRAVAIRPDFSDAWLALGDLLYAAGRAAEADAAYCSYARHALQEPRLARPAALLRDNRLAEAEAMLRGLLGDHPTDVCAQSLMADLAMRRAQFDVAGELLAGCLERAPGYRPARHNYAVVLLRQGRPQEALRQVDALLAGDAASYELRTLKAAVLLRLASYDEAVAVYEDVVADYPQRAAAWASLGHAQRTLGRLDGCLRAYRKAAELEPGSGEAAWNLANLKTYRIGDAELDAMQAQLGRPDLAAGDRIHFHFAVGKALEDRGEFDAAFRHYADGNRLQRARVDYDPDDMTRHVQRCKTLLTREFFAARRDRGAAADDPIFVVGLPRSGSTLVEQILASHSAVEGTMELPHVIGMAKSLSERAPANGAGRYPELLADLGADACSELGRSYIAQISVQRKMGTAHFIDKMPNNFAHIGLIQLMLPRARIIDVRRQPMACGLSLFRHLFAHGQYFSYSLPDIGRYYRDYVDLMEHFELALPGRVYRLHYEDLVEHTECEVRRLLAYCGLPFEQSCLEFHRNRRAVSTPSSEQVRRPVFRDGLVQWRHFESWLEPLRRELGAAESAKKR